MDNFKRLSFAIKDSVLGADLSPSNFTLPLLSEFIEQVTTFIRGKGRPDLGQIKTRIERGSLTVVVENKEELLDDAVRDYTLLQQNKDLEDVTDPIRAEIIGQWQLSAKSKHGRTYEIFTEKIPTQDVLRLIISDKTNYELKKKAWVDVELYLYGKVYDLGGKNKPNVHIELENGKTIKIGAHILTLKKDNENRLYKTQLVRIKAKQNVSTHKLKDERLISFEHYNPVFDEDEFERIAKKANIAWKSVKSATDWVESLRGNND
ncbi:hypothetical protein COT75_03195 [Candidatus Beckwithbacteria bacterium CG10_big_fil_rev_8_21_14_0_10_34_10]|uniref:Uncharacterized protein n=1 Tax=Candidatus Beckwithbacteria bacterium CG10_big_fil_rev_8_21_14_0_10_34_10 TaxID=1974495 RepID=A0A2H0WB19_9BACT|nr:MAG: hypothetical protein COT75_03195 [Candidatus Beckwithbacteria bacterium CG10_big_fil_rev_8_21_14_0_10_34_10]